MTSTKRHVEHDNESRCLAQQCAAAVRGNARSMTSSRACQHHQAIAGVSCSVHPVRRRRCDKSYFCVAPTYAQPAYLTTLPQPRMLSIALQEPTALAGCPVFMPSLRRMPVVQHSGTS